MIKHYKIFGGARLPSAYQEVEYLESTGTQQILLREFTQLPIKLSVRWALTDITSDIKLIGVNNGKATNLGHLNLSQQYGGGYRDSGIPTSLDTVDITIELTSNSKLLTVKNIDGTVIGTSTNWWALNTSTHLPFALFGAWSAATPRYAKYKLYSCVIESDEQSYNLIPCYRKSDSVAGMYDLVSNTFLTNAGSGSFIVGADVSSTILIPTYKRAYILNNTKISTYKSAKKINGNIIS